MCFVERMTSTLLIVLGALLVAGALRVLPLRIALVGVALVLVSSAPWLIDWVTSRVSAGLLHPTGAAVTDLLLAGLAIAVMVGLVRRRVR